MWKSYNIDNPNIRVVITAIRVATISIKTIVQLTTHGIFKMSQTSRIPIVSTLKILKHKKRVEEIFSIIDLVMKCKQVFQEEFFYKLRKKNIFRTKCGLYYIKPHTIH